MLKKRLGVNIDHVATLRNVRGEALPSVLEAALIAESNGADLITVHLREDRRHINDNDVLLLRQCLKTQLNLEIAATREMLEIAAQIKPDYVCFVPEKRQELTTEGGLNVSGNINNLAQCVEYLQQNDILVTLFINPDAREIEAARSINAYGVEIHTGNYASVKDDLAHSEELEQIQEACLLASSLGLMVNAGHGLNYHNVSYIATIAQISDLHIGHALISRSVFCGLPQAVREMKQLIDHSCHHL